MNECLNYFLQNFNKTGTIIEIGTKRWNGVRNTRRDYWPEAQHIGVDYLEGEDVDMVVDAMKLSETFGENYADAIFTASTFEHISKPWIAAQEILKVLKPNGVWFCQSHFNFPEHGFPNDYMRFSTEAWKVLFEGCSEIIVGKEFDAILTPPKEITVWDKSAPVYLNSMCAGRK